MDLMFVILLLYTTFTSTFNNFRIKQNCKKMEIPRDILFFVPLICVKPNLKIGTLFVFVNFKKIKIGENDTLNDEDSYRVSIIVACKNFHKFS